MTGVFPVGFKGAAIPLQASDMKDAADRLGCTPRHINTVWEVETGQMPAFDRQGRPRILFESAKFSKYTDGQFDRLYPSISKPKWVADYGLTSEQYNRLEMAISIDLVAALKSASWGMFQVMGFNHAMCGYLTVNDFVEAMCHSAANQVDAFVKFIQATGLQNALAARDWREFARGYNGSGQVAHYSAKLADAYAKQA